MKKKNGIDAGADVIVNAVLIGKARSKVISAAKRWKKSISKRFDDGWPISDITLFKVIEKLERLENPAKNQNSRRLSDGK